MTQTTNTTDTVDIKDIAKEVKKLYPGKKVKPWFPKYVNLTVFNNKTVTDCSKILGISRTAIYDNIDAELKEYIQQKKDERFAEYNQVAYSLVDESLKALTELIKNSENDSVRLKAAEIVLKKFDIISDKQNLNITGKLELPIISVVTEYRED